MNRKQMNRCAKIWRPCRLFLLLHMIGHVLRLATRTQLAHGPQGSLDLTGGKKWDGDIAAAEMRSSSIVPRNAWLLYCMVFLVPSAAFSAADRVEHVGYLLAIWIGASVASVASVISAANDVLSLFTSR